MRPSTSTSRRSYNHKHSSSRGIWSTQTSAKKEQDRKASNHHWWNWSCLGGQDPLQMYIGVSPGGLQLLCLWSEDGCHAPSDGCPFGTVACKRLSERMDDVLWYLHCCLEEKRLEQFLIGSEAVPAEIILCQDFWVSKPLNLFQCLVQELANYFWVQRELDELPDQLTRLLISRQWQTSTCLQTSFSWRGYCRDAWDLYRDVALLPFPFTYWAYSQLTPAQVCISSEDQRWGKIISQIQKYFQNLWDKDRNHSSKL